METRRTSGVCALVVVAAAMAILVTGVSGGNAVKGFPPSGPSSPAARPVEIVSIRPAQGRQVCRLPRIEVDLRLTDAMRKAGAFDLSTVTLTLDGKDVTRKARVAGTMDYPQRRASLVYTPEKALAIGAHQAAFTFPSEAGRKTYRWMFTVADIPCS